MEAYRRMYMRSDRMLFRHELKFIISEPEKEALIRRLGTVLPSDAHADGGGYMIRSLYFDDCFERAYEEKLAGVESRRKYRIRIYNCSDSVIKLECKRKEGKYINKISASLFRAEAEAVIAGRYEFLAGRPERVCRDFYIECVSNAMRPKVIVDYDRVPFVFPYGDVRITFDSGIRAGLSCCDLFDSGIPVKQVMEQGRLIMEVKFTEYLPELVRALLSTAEGEYTAYSKYTMCLEKKKELSGGH